MQDKTPFYLNTEVLRNQDYHENNMNQASRSRSQHSLNKPDSLLKKNQFIKEDTVISQRNPSIIDSNKASNKTLASHSQEKFPINHFTTTKQIEYQNPWNNTIEPDIKAKTLSRPSSSMASYKKSPRFETTNEKVITDQGKITNHVGIHVSPNSHRSSSKHPNPGLNKIERDSKRELKSTINTENHISSSRNNSLSRFNNLSNNTYTSSESTWKMEDKDKAIKTEKNRNNKDCEMIKGLSSQTQKNLETLNHIKKSRSVRGSLNQKDFNAILGGNLKENPVSSGTNVLNHQNAKSSNDLLKSRSNNIIKPDHSMEKSGVTGNSIQRIIIFQQTQSSKENPLNEKKKFGGETVYDADYKPTKFSSNLRHPITIAPNNLHIPSNSKLSHQTTYLDNHKKYFDEKWNNMRPAGKLDMASIEYEYPNQQNQRSITQSTSMSTHKSKTSLQR